MKNSLFFVLTAVLLSVTVHAQKAPAMIDLPENQRIMGHYNSDAISTEGAKLNVIGKNSIGTILESEEIDIFNGGKILAFRVGLAESTPVTKVFVVPIAAGGAYGSMISWSCNVNEIGWNVVTLPSPYQLDVPEGGRLLIGFEYEQTATNNPLALVQEGDIYDTYYYKKARWATAGLKSKGNLCLQCIVEKDHFPEVLIKSYGLESIEFVQKGDELPFSFYVKNRGTKALDTGSLTFDVNIDDQKMATVSNPVVIEPDSIVMIQDVLQTDDLASGSHELIVDNAVVDGEVLDYVYPMTVTFMQHSGSYPRQKHLVEQFTSTYCTYCPLGNSMLTILKGLRDDIIWVGVHGDLNGGIDPFTTIQGDSIMSFEGSSSYPSGSFDRATGWDSNLSIVNGLGYYEEYHQQIAEELSLFFEAVTQHNPTFATIEINPEVNLETREAVITVSGEMSPDFDALLGDDNKLTVYLTEDSLVARQVNNGTWVNKYVHNGVFRCALGSVKGVDFNRVGDGYSNEFRVTLPDNWIIPNMNVVAFISRPLENHVYTDMLLNNAESVRLYNKTGGVEEILSEGDVVPVEFYDVMGRKLDAPRQGINIVRMSNGTAKKVLIK